MDVTLARPQVGYAWGFGLHTCDVVGIARASSRVAAV